LLIPTRILLARYAMSHQAPRRSSSAAPVLFWKFAHGTFKASIPINAHGLAEGPLQDFLNMFESLATRRVPLTTHYSTRRPQYQPPNVRKVFNLTGLHLAETVRETQMPVFPRSDEKTSSPTSDMSDSDTTGSVERDPDLTCCSVCYATYVTMDYTILSTILSDHLW